MVDCRENCCGEGLLLCWILGGVCDRFSYESKCCHFPIDSMSPIVIVAEPSEIVIEFAN